MARASMSKESVTKEAQGYVTDTEYVYGSFEELMPVNLKFSAALNGYKTPSLKEEFTYLDLGCGHAYTLCLAAADHPNSKFYGVDLMPEHIAWADNLCKKSKLKNIFLINKSFHELDLDKLPEFDFIVTHGVLTWVNQEVRGQLRNIVDKKLKKGGLFYVSYDTLPGWSVKEPFLELAQYFTDPSLNSVDRMKQVMALMSFLCKEKAGYFAQNPYLMKEVEMMAQENLHYLAHEYLLKDWKAFYFREIAQFFGEIGLSYAGCFPYRNNFIQYMIPKNFHDLLKSQKSIVAVEEYKDFIRNNRFRKDIFVRDQIPLNDFQSRLKLFDEIYITSMSTTEELKEEIKINNMTYHMSGPGYQVLRQIFPNKSLRIKDVFENEFFKKITPEEAYRAVCDFIALGQAIPLGSPLVECDKVDLKKLKFTHPMNEYLTEHLLPLKNRISLVCPSGGIFVTSSHASAIVLRALIESHGNVEKAEKMAMKIAETFSPGVKIYQDEKALKMVMSSLQNKFLTWLVRLGVLSQ